MKTFLLLCSLVVGSSFGEILSAKGMKQIGDLSLRFSALLPALLRMIRNPYLIAGVCCLAISFFSFISLLSYADLSFVVPLTATAYITNTLGARFFLKEKVSKGRWLGTLMVTCGVLLISFADRIEAIMTARGALDSLRKLYLSITPHELMSQGEPLVAYWFVFAIRIALLFCVVAAIIYYHIALVAGLSWFRDRSRQRALGLAYTPPVTIFKPVRGVDAGAYENFASFCRQDYPEYQIIFGVSDEKDPAIAIIKRLITDFPAGRIDLVISSKEFGCNAKVSNLQNMYARADHDLLLIADSDIRVEPDYLRRVIAPMQQPHAGMVTCLYRGAEAKTFADRLENIGLSSAFAPDVCSSRAIEGMAFAFGSTIVMRRELLESIGGFQAVADYLADDFQLGNRTAKAGYEVVLSDCVVEHVAGSETLTGMLKHQLRWGRSIRSSRPGGYCGLILTHGTATALLALLAWNFSNFAWWLFAITMLARYLPVFVIGVYGLKDFALARHFWLVPLRDLVGFGVWVMSFASNRIEWRGMKFRVLPDGRLAPLKNHGSSREVLRTNGVR